MEPAHGVGAGEGDQAQEEVEDRRLRGEDVLAELLSVLERADAREVDAFVVVGVGPDEPAEEQRLRCDEERERKALRSERGAAG